MRPDVDGDRKTEILCVDISDFSCVARKEKDRLEQLTGLLSTARRGKISALRDDEARLQSLAAGLLLDYGLQKRGYRERDVVIREGIHGKPYISGIPGLFYNLSHSGNRILAVFSDRPAGCDVQIVKPGSSRIAGRFFTREEAEYVRESGEHHRDEVFTELWTLKESYLKATGEGMSRELKSFCVLDGCRPPGASFRVYDMGNYKAAVCVLAGTGWDFREMILPDICFCPFQNLLDVV